MYSSFAWFLLLTLSAWNPCREWVVFSFSPSFPLLTLLAWNSHPESELYPALPDFHGWHSIKPLSNLIQTVRCVQLLCLIFISEIACIKSHPDCESCVAPLLDFYYWHYLYDLLSRLWVICSSLALFPFLTLFAWTSIQRVGCVQLLCLIFIADIVWMKSHPESELYAAPSLDFHYWHYIKPHPESMLCEAPLLDFHCWYFLGDILSREWVICSFSARFLLLTLPAYTPIQEVSCVQLCAASCFMSIADILCINSYPESELCAAPLLDFYA